MTYKLFRLLSSLTPHQEELPLFALVWRRRGRPGARLCDSGALALATPVLAKSLPARTSVRCDRTREDLGG